MNNNIRTSLDVEEYQVKNSTVNGEEEVFKWTKVVITFLSQIRLDGNFENLVEEDRVVIKIIL